MRSRFRNLAGVLAGVAAALGLGLSAVASRAGSPEVRKGYAGVNGLSMYYEIHGRPNGSTPPLVLLHGGDPTIKTSFGPILPLLAAHRLLVAFEQQGHGRTADVDRPFSFEQTAQDTVALLDYLGIAQADLYGYSNGGHIAIEVALRHPERVRRLVIQSAMFSRDGSDPSFWESFRHARLEDMPAELRQAYLKTAPHPDQLPTFFAKSVQRMAQFKGWTPEQIHSIAAPTMVLAGDHDIVRPEHAVQMYRLLPHASLAILPATDHMGMVSRAEWLAPMIEAFLDSPAATPEPKR